MDFEEGEDCEEENVRNGPTPSLVVQELFLQLPETRPTSEPSLGTPYKRHPWPFFLILSDTSGARTNSEAGPVSSCCGPTSGGCCSPSSGGGGCCLSHHRPFSSTGTGMRALTAVSVSPRGAPCAVMALGAAAGLAPENHWGTTKEEPNNCGPAQPDAFTSCLSFLLTEFPPRCPASKPSGLASLLLKCPRPSAPQSVPRRALPRCPAPVSSCCGPGPRAAVASADWDIRDPAVSTALRLLPSWALSITQVTSRPRTGSSPVLLIPQSRPPLDESHLGDKTTPALRCGNSCWHRDSGLGSNSLS
eukprot:bmy_19015T0